MTLWALLAEIALQDIAEIGYQCSQTERDDFRCDDIATHTVHWPSGDTRCCDRHTQQWRRLAVVMGMANLQATPLPVRRNTPAPDEAAERFALMELT